MLPDLVKLTSYTRRADKLLAPDDEAALDFFLASTPTAGAVISGTGGFRKVRWALEGRGKSGGARVITFPRLSGRLYLVLIYPKGKKDSLSPAEKNRLKALADSLS